jgi:hypothetical protein
LYAYLLHAAASFVKKRISKEENSIISVKEKK